MIRCMQRTNIYLEDRQTLALDRLATDAGVSRAEIIRRMLDRALGGTDDDPTNDLAAIDASFGTLVELDLPDRGDDDRQQHLARVWQAAP